MPNTIILNRIYLFLLNLIFVLPVLAQKNDSITLVDVSANLLEKIKNGSNTNELRAQLYTTSFDVLQNELKSDSQKLAFWVNIYNAYIQILLAENPSLYDDKRAFFKKEQIPIAGRMLSFEKIEHGILRKSQWPLGLGLIRKWFPDKFERKLRIKNRDYRVHFALNCGAKDCPPVAIYQADRLDEQFAEGTTRYLQRTTVYTPEKNEVAVSALFNWFRGDFGCKKGVKKIVKNQEIIPTSRGVEVRYQNYDWTLQLDNWIVL